MTALIEPFQRWPRSAKYASAVLSSALVVTTTGWIFNLRPLEPVWGSIADVVTATATVVLLAGLWVTFQQVRTGVDAVASQQRATKAELLTHFNAEWRSPAMYESSKYILQLSQAWERQGGSASGLAEGWTQKHFNAREDPERAEMTHRRQVSQFLRHAGYLLKKQYLDPDDVFSVAPETGRMLSVIIPIENAIMAMAMQREEVASAGHTGQHLARKYELDLLLSFHEEWRGTQGHSRFGMHPRLPVTDF